MSELFKPDLEAVLAHYSVDLPYSYSGDGWAKISCPMPDHEDGNPSATYNGGLGKWACFGCDRRGDALDLIQEWEKIDCAQAAEWAREKFPEAADTGREGRVSRKSRRNVRDGDAPPRNGGRRNASARVRTGRTRWD